MPGGRKLSGGNDEEGEEGYGARVRYHSRISSRISNALRHTRALRPHPVFRGFKLNLSIWRGDRGNVESVFLRESRDRSVVPFSAGNPPTSPSARVGVQEAGRVVSVTRRRAESNMDVNRISRGPPHPRAQDPSNMLYWIPSRDISATTEIPVNVARDIADSDTVLERNSQGGGREGEEEGHARCPSSSFDAVAVVFVRSEHRPDTRDPRPFVPGRRRHARTCSDMRDVLHYLRREMEIPRSAGSFQRPASANGSRRVAKLSYRGQTVSGSDFKSRRHVCGSETAGFPTEWAIRVGASRAIDNLVSVLT